MKRLPYNEERIRQALNVMCDPNIPTEQVFTIMEATSRAMMANNRVHRANADQAHRAKVAAVRKSGDMDALRKLANENLAKRRK